MSASKKVRFFIVSFLLMLSVLLTLGCTGKRNQVDVSMYQYQDTKDLVRFVYNASLILKKGGMDSLDYFKKHPELFKKKNYYLYIYDIDGNNLYHAGMANLEGENLKTVSDKDGKRINQLIVSALANKHNPHGWVHYFWWKPGKFYSVPKSSCNFKVTMADGKELFVGGGISYPHEEKEFVRIVVDSAAQLIKTEGKAALAKIIDPTSQYNYRDVQVFVFRENGETVISPTVASSVSHIDLLACSDEVGHKPFVKALKRLQSHEKVWEIFMAKNRYKRKLIKKCLYVHKSVMDGKKVFVAAITDLPEPPY